MRCDLPDDFDIVPDYDEPPSVLTLWAFDLAVIIWCFLVAAVSVEHVFRWLGLFN